MKTVQQRKNYYDNLIKKIYKQWRNKTSGSRDDLSTALDVAVHLRDCNFAHSNRKVKKGLDMCRYIEE